MKRARLTERGREMARARGSSDAEFRAMLKYFGWARPKHPRCGHPPGPTLPGSWMREAFAYARQVKRQMLSEGVSKHGVNAKAAQKAAHDLMDRGFNYFGYDYEDLWQKLRTGIRNSR
jgi:hypothetical protein